MIGALVIVALLIGVFAGYYAAGGWMARPEPGAPSGPGVPNGPVTPPVGGEPACKPGQAADYFPYKLGTKAAYAGLGNEYASYTLQVVHQSGSKVEWRRDNGGTVMAEVYDVTPQQVTLVYREGEAYDANPRLNLPANEATPILKGPVQAGTTWAAGDTTYTILQTDASVQALNQTLTCVVVVESKTQHSRTLWHYHRQYGMVLSIFDPGGHEVESRLSSFTP